jgi:3-oxoacyl-(acyl-carrier-protein) synthase
VFARVSDNSHLHPEDLELSGLGWAVESIPTPTGISHDAAAFERSMRMAIQMVAARGIRIGAVVAHAPGTARGDTAELAAIRRVLGEVPVLSTKHLTGHSYGASGMLSLSLADALLSGVQWEGFPYTKERSGSYRVPHGSGIMINSAGFGGNAISLIVNRPTDA